MQPLFRTALLALAGTVTAFAAQPASEPDWKAIVGAYPQPGTPQFQNEVAIMIWLQRTRTAADITRLKMETHPSLGGFGPIIGQAKDGPAPFPKTQAILQKVQDDLDPILASLMTSFARPRPYVTVPALTPIVPGTTSCSYPSSTAAMNVVYAQIFTQWMPERRDALKELGDKLGNDMAVAGLSWPSDVEAGQRLGRAFATFWINQPDNRQMIIEACNDEWHPQK
jgi:acid phosphatase (class A)